MTEQWRTPEEIAAARARLEAAIVGYLPPAAYGVGRVTGGQLHFARISTGQHGQLPAAVLATVCGHARGDGSYRLDVAGLDRAIAQLTPAEACTSLPHPNLAAWRQLRGELGSGDQVAVVFAACLAPDMPPADPDVAALLREIARA